jgi:hypothetical protein
MTAAFTHQATMIASALRQLWHGRLSKDVVGQSAAAWRGTSSRCRRTLLTTSGIVKPMGGRVLYRGSDCKGNTPALCASKA